MNKKNNLKKKNKKCLKMIYQKKQIIKFHLNQN